MRYCDDLNTFKNYFETNYPNSDKGVLFTTYDYKLDCGTGLDLFGAAFLSGDVAIVEVRPGLPTWVYTHEFGHLFGGQHDNVSSQHCERAYVLSGGFQATPITNGTSYSRIEYYSDPATFGATDRWNAGIIQNAWCSSSSLKSDDITKSIKISPNPSIDNVQISVKEYDKVAQIIVKDDMGSILEILPGGVESLDLDISNYRVGLYFVELVSKSGEIITGKFLKY